MQSAASTKIVLVSLKNRFVSFLHTCSRNTLIYEKLHTRFECAQKRRISRIKVKVVIIKNGLALLFAHVFEKYVDFVGASNYIKTKAKNIDL